MPKGWRSEGLGVSEVFLFFSHPCPVLSEEYPAETGSVLLEFTVCKLLPNQHNS